MVKSIKKVKHTSLALTLFTLCFCLLFLCSIVSPFVTSGILDNLSSTYALQDTSSLVLADYFNNWSIGDEFNPPEQSAESKKEFLLQALPYISRIPYITIGISIAFGFLLAYVNGWINLKNQVKNCKFSISFKILPFYPFNPHRVKWYLGKKTFSYGFFRERIVLGMNFFLVNNQYKTFRVCWGICSLSRKCQ